MALSINGSDGNCRSALTRSIVANAWIGIQIKLKPMRGRSAGEANKNASHPAIRSSP